MPLNFKFFFSCLIVSLFFVTSSQAFAFSVHISSGKSPAENVVVLLSPVNKENVTTKPSPSKRISIKQENKLFEPFVTVAPVGTIVDFPNEDPTRHHIYSFSKAKEFQLPLYLGKSKEVLFDMAGVVSMGCNIHDWMLGYLVIVDSPYYGLSDTNGIVDFGELPEGEYTISYWYPGLSQKAGLMKAKQTVSSTQESYSITIPSRAIKKRPEARDEEDEESDWG